MIKILSENFSFPNKTLMNKNKYHLKDTKDEIEMYCQGCDQKYLKKFSQFFEKNKTNKELTDSTLLKINQKYIFTNHRSY